MISFAGTTNAYVFNFIKQNSMADAQTWEMKTAPAIKNLGALNKKSDQYKLVCKPFT